ncbi:MAG: hypothetical protein ACKOYM_02375 [Actinomycetes bacterium]
MTIGGVDVPTRYLVGIGATVVALLILIVADDGGQRDSAGPSTPPTKRSTTSITVRSGRSPISIREQTAADIELRYDWVVKGSSQYADPSDDRSSTQTITTLPPSTSSSVLPRYRPSRSATADSTGG